MHLLLSLFLLFKTLPASCSAVAPGEIQGYFSVYFEQNGQRYDLNKGTVTLQAAPFDLVIELSEPGGILLNASLEPFTYKPARKGKSKEKLLGFVDAPLQEGYFNRSKDILLADDAPNYWFYASDSSHTFSQVSKGDGVFICKRRIEKITFPKTKQQEVIEGNMPALYLVFLSMRQSGNGKEMELRRITALVNFTRP